MHHSFVLCLTMHQTSITQRILKLPLVQWTQYASHCPPLKFCNEALGIYCVSGKVVLSAFTVPSKPLELLIAGESEDLKLFLCKYVNSILAFKLRH